ncbi:unnamed protein product [Arabidopsis thaliana]|uniref:(thale cress) hypothetical protein n=1 Tax=Arabidopsis thaliana TaxID=3702 RepID=A0A7G2F0R4_ARATH|nr:unnamed protein product [Arabidopsis thaliana]
MSPSLSYFPFLINSRQDQVYVGYNNNTFHDVLDTHISQPLETKNFVSDGGSSSSDQMVPKKETRLKLTIKKKDNHQDQTDLPQSPIKDMTGTNSLKWISSKNGYNNDCVIRICSDCNTTKTPLWRSGPRGPKSLCNACGIRQRKARRAAMATATATATAVSGVSPPVMKKKMQNKNKISNGVYKISSPLPLKVNTCKRMITLEETALAEDLETQSNSTMLSSSDNIYFDDLALLLSKSSAYQQVFPQDEKEAAILLMALSHGMVHG